MKKVFGKLFVLVVAFSMIAAISANAMVGINFNGNAIDFEKEPVIVNDRTMVPAEEFFESAKIPFEKENGSIKLGNLAVEENKKVADGEVLPFVKENTLFMPLRAVCEALGMNVQWDNDNRLVNILQKEELSAEAMPVKNGAKAAAVLIHDDGAKATGNWLIDILPKYNLYTTVGIIGKSIDPEYNVDEPDNFEKWRVIIDSCDGRMNLAAHSHGHRYLGETDEEESGVLSNGTEYSYEAGHMTKDIADERERINSIYPDERVLTFIKPGTLYPEGKPQVSDAAIAMIKEHYIAMRNTGGGVDTLSPEDVYSVKSIMANASTDYTNPEDNQPALYWIELMNTAIEQNGLIVYLFHGIKDEKEASGISTAQSRAEMLFEEIYKKTESGELWNGQFDEVMQYTQEYDAITSVKAENYPADKKITVKVEDSISKIDTDIKTGKFANLDMFDYPITVKVELPYDWEYVKLTQAYNNRKEIVKPFTEDGKKYVYANVVPDQDAAVLTEADSAEYVSAEVGS